ncbi:simple sugar transport system permease protein [Pseudochelatococcus lubricantis]|uniref:Simple sugar transport system permease protein n=1 Tax=Pseudochelatococcus lubricantis TaxID=1538102 RepID=A0ABX0UY36_9HYPH|nr:ABC transporter permease [Pseudochelatococcus lubricantis]NIJ57857.1 simple sugar transport system permease protein [Pseudochelatococcus lubricantis]
MRLELVRRPESPWFGIVAPLLAVALTVASGFVLFLALGLDPVETLYQFMLAPLTTFQSLTELGVKGAPLALIATGLAIGFRANVWNIGAEGQLIIGAIAAGGVALAFWNEAGWWILPLMLAASVAGGMAWAAIPAFLKTRFGVNEILTSLMLTYVASLILQMLVFGPWKDPDGFNYPQTRLFSEAALLPVLIEGTRLHAGALVALLAALAAWFVMARTVTGFEIAVVGDAPQAARFAGFSTRRTVWLSFLVGGGAAGLAGAFEAAGPIGQLVPVLTPGYGFTAIIVAFLGRLSPPGIVAAAALMALTYIGGENAQITAGLPQAATGVFQGMLLFYLLATDGLLRFRIRLTGARSPRAAQP